MITEIIEFAGFDGHLVPICISARNSRLNGDGCFELLDKLEFVEFFLFKTYPVCYIHIAKSVFAVY